MHLVDHLLAQAFHEGDTRSTSIQVSVDEIVVIPEWTSSGNTLDFESISLEGNSGQEIILAGLLADREWIDITEVRASKRGECGVCCCSSYSDAALFLAQDGVGVRPCEGWCRPRLCCSLRGKAVVAVPNLMTEP